MARNGSGVYSLAAGNPVVTGTTISSTTHNNTMSDIATALTDSLAKDGQTTPTADLPMGTYKHTGVGNAAARNQYAAVGQVQDQGFIWCSTAGGAANAFTLTPSPAITAYVAGQRFMFLAVGTNSSSVTCAVSGLAAKAVQLSGLALSSGVIVSGKLYAIVYDGTQFQMETVSVQAGTWTPSLGGTATYNVQSGFYIKIGKLVYVECDIEVNLIGTGSVSTVSGLPFTVENAVSGASISSFLNLATAVVSLYGAFGSTGTTSITFKTLVAASANIGSASVFGNNTTLFFSGSYLTG